MFSRSVLCTNYVVQDSGVTGPVDVTGATLAALFVNVTTMTGTTPAMAVWLQGSPDDGTTWMDIAANTVCTSAVDTYTHTGAQTTSRNIIALSATTGAAVAVYRDLPWKHVRARWLITGTTPEATVSISLDTK